ncbi:phosphoglycerate dehydrogenase [Synchytrium microbalum]|uniref:Phosphoglycerate dehydrogenase n=1 Tax=Synchytrium microbalum TaxID=1806994 RepID=A0A507C9P4_9FUNG|nr:phosphoglycerate dehydrogenase [Synchytrium microbalum]TPX34225.1 phosphoglycerate dehydrogenase [Synchytrium microbalum]
MAQPIPIGGARSNGYADESTSPTSSVVPSSFVAHSFSKSYAGSPAQFNRTPAKVLRPFATTDFKILLLENVNETAVDLLKAQGYQVEFHTKSLSPELLKEKIRDVHVIGIRSKTNLTAEILKEAKRLRVIGCFCIGTNQVDLEYAAKAGIAVFNSPFSNSRSVAEMVLSEVIALSRQLGDRNNEMHQGNWNKVSANCYEIRGKTLGIVGYGHIGSQLSVLADAFGMSVIFFDVMQMMPLGTARPQASLDDLLKQADFITLHVPETPDTANMISSRELAIMKKGSYLINASRGTVVDIQALASALKSGHLGGAAVDVYPTEPFANGKGFVTELQGCPNTILTPHIGGSTEEAQSAIGVEVANALIRYVNSGTSLGAVNFPEVDLRVPFADSHTVRVVNCHQNVPGVLRQMTKILSEFNIEKQICDSKGPIAYFMADITADLTHDEMQKLYSDINKVPESIWVRIVY